MRKQLSSSANIIVWFFFFFFFKDLNQIKLKCHGRNSAHYKTMRQQITSTSEELPWNFPTNGSDWKTVPHQCVPVHIEVQIRPEHQNAHAQNMQMYKLFKKVFSCSLDMSRNNDDKFPSTITMGRNPPTHMPKVMSRINGRANLTGSPRCRSISKPACRPATECSSLFSEVFRKSTFRRHSKSSVTERTGHARVHVKLHGREEGLNINIKT